jgi:cyclopropane fatty-acyl-phospholipid synthase-like methyltransferase
VIEAVDVAGTPAPLRARIATYYDHTQVLYSRLWSKERLHYGFWDPGTRKREDAIRNLDHFVARALRLPAGASVLDAGCGIGGTSILLAHEYGLDVTGLTLSPVQLRGARRLAEASPVTHRVRFALRDYLASGFLPASFDGLVAIESSCYAEPKARFCREAFRLLKPGGRLVVSDGFVARPLRGRERVAYRRLLDGFALDGLASVDEFGAALRDTGFEAVECHDKRAAIMPSAHSIERLSGVGVAVCTLLCLLRLAPRTWLRHGLAGLSQRPLFATGALTYCVFVATKPAR